MDKNYLYLAEKKGAEVRADTEVTWVRPLPDGVGYEVEALHGASIWSWRRRRQRFTARKVIFAGGVLGTLPLLLRLQSSKDGLPHLSARLGSGVRTNSEALIGVISQSRKVDYSEGIAIGSILHTDPHSHIEPVSFGAGSGAYRFAGLPHVAGHGLLARIARVALVFATQPLKVLRAYLVDDWAKRTVIALYMRTVDGTLRLTRRWWWPFNRGLSSTADTGEPPRAYMPQATELVQQLGKEVDGLPMSLINETLLNVPTTAHILGGCCMGESTETGVIDNQHRVFGHDGLYVIDGSSISANPGVNPSLSITALAERAMSFIPDKTAD